MARISDVLMEAADVLGRCGWTKGLYRGVDDTVCLIGAIAEASGEYDMAYVERTDPVRHLDGSLRLEPHTDVTAWNDRQACVEDVQHALRYAALEAFSEGK